MRALLGCVFVCTALAACNIANLSTCDTSLWASTVIGFSTAYDGYPATSALGPYNVYPLYEDNQDAWCPTYKASGAEYLELGFDQTINIASIQIYETSAPGALVKLYVGRPDGNILVWSGSASELGPPSRIYTPALWCATQGNRVRLEMDTSGFSDWHEVDAVSIVGSVQPVIGMPACSGNCSLSCLNGGTCFLSNLTSVCGCQSDFSGPLCEMNRQYPVSIIESSSIDWESELLGIPDDSFGHFSIPGKNQWVEFAFFSAAYVGNVVVHGDAASAVSSVAVLTPNNTWQEVWSGVAPLNITRFDIGGVQCNPQFRSRTVRVTFDFTRAPELNSIDTIDVQTRPNASSTSVCMDKCPSLVGSCNVGKCYSSIATAATCACPNNATGAACALFYQYPVSVVDYSPGEYIETSPVGPPDGEAFNYGSSSGPIHVTYAFDLPVFLNDFDIVALNNDTLLAVARVWARANATASWYVVWDRGLGNGTTPLCQPNDVVQILRIEFLLPPCTPTCTYISVDTVRLTGSFDALVARNGSLPTCPTTCVTSNPCQNAQPCIVSPNGTANCVCFGYDGSHCEQPINFVAQVLNYSWRPYKPLIEGLVGPPDVYPMFQKNRDCWSAQNCNDTWSFPNSEDTWTQFVEVKFRFPSSAVATALYETSGFGTVTRVMAYRVDHWVEVWANSNGTNWSRDDPSPKLARETMVVWKCNPNFVTDRIRLEFNTSLDSNTWNEIDAIRLFNTSELIARNLTVPVGTCVDSGCNAFGCGGVAAGECVGSSGGPYCVCSRDFSGTHCEIQERWPVAASGTSDTKGALQVVGVPDMYPLTSAPINKPYLAWAPVLSSVLTLDFELNQSLYLQQVEFFNLNFYYSRMNLTSIAIGTDSYLKEVWEGGLEISGNARQLVSVSNWGCLANFTRIQFIFASSDSYGYQVELDSVGLKVGSTAQNSSTPLCMYDECLSNPCENGGTCYLNAMGDRSCKCLNGYDGDNCELSGLWWASGVKDFSTRPVSDYPEIARYEGNILGAPNIGTLGSDAGAFRFEPRDNEGVLLFEFIEVSFPVPVYLSGVQVIEALNPGCITKLLVRKNAITLDDNDPFMEIWSRANGLGASQPLDWNLTQFQPTLQCVPDFAVQSLRIEVNTSLAFGWEEYDAVALLGSLTQPSPTIATCVNTCNSSTCVRGVCVAQPDMKTYCQCSPLWTGRRCDRPSPLQMRSFARNQFAVMSAGFRYQYNWVDVAEPCHIDTAGDLYCYGHITLHKQHPANARFVQVVMSEIYVCALDAAGRAECWDRALGNSLFVSPVTLSSISVGWDGLCGIRERDSRVQCFMCESCPMESPTKHVSVIPQIWDTVVAFMTYAGQITFQNLFWYYSNQGWSYSLSYVALPLTQFTFGWNGQWCALDVSGAVMCESKTPLVNSPAAPWGFVALGGVGDVCAIYAATGVVMCQKPNVSDLAMDLGPIAGQQGILALQMDLVRSSSRTLCATDSFGSLKCIDNSSISTLNLPANATVALPCDYMNGGCGAHMICSNMVAGPKCTCAPGFNTVVYRDLGFSECEDIDECALDLLSCVPPQICLNSIGSAQCVEPEPPSVYHVIGCTPILENVSYLPANCSTKGGDVVIVCGKNFTTSPKMLGRLAGECTPFERVLNSTQPVTGNVSVFCPDAFSCRIPEGQGTDIEISVSMEGREYPLANMFYSYAPPFLSRLGGCTTECDRDELPRPVLEIEGKDFGLKPVVLVGGSNCPLITSNHTFISCHLPVGRGTPFVSVLTGGQFSNVLPISYRSCPLGMTDVIDQVNFTCIACAPGFAKDVIGSSPCVLCPSGKYALGSGSPKCNDCGQSGLTCLGGLPSSTEQFWGFPANNVYSVVRCPPNHCLANNECAAGRVQSSSNVLCGACKPGLLNWGNTCVECPGFNLGLFIFVILLCELFLVLAHLMKRGSQKAGVTRLLMYFLQIALVMAGSSRLHIGFLNIINFDFASASTAISNFCVFPISPEDQLVVSLLLPVIFLGVLVFNFGFRRATWKLFARLCDGIEWLRPWKKRPTINGYARSALAILMFAYSSTCTKVFTFLRCQEVNPDGMAPVRVMFYYPTISCDAQFYNQFEPFLIFVLVFYILGFPIVSGCVLSYWHRKGLLQKKIEGPWGVLYALYQPRAYFWLSVELLLRFIFALVDSQLASNYLIRAAMFSFINLGALMAQLFAQPYLDAPINKLESLVHSILLCLSFLLSMDAVGNVPEEASWVFFAFVIIVIIALVAFATYHKTKALHTSLTQSRLSKRREDAMHSTAELSPQTVAALPEQA